MSGNKRPKTPSKFTEPRTSSKSSPKSSPPDFFHEPAIDRMLSSFCDSIQFPEISLSEWEDVHSSLDIMVPIWLSPNEIRDGCVRQIRFCRTARNSGDSSKIKVKEDLKIEIPPQINDVAQIRILGFGDKIGDRSGDLIVQVFRKR